MHVQLDQELWEMADSVRLEEVLTRISDTAHAKGRLVTKLMVGERRLTDRDLLPGVLSQPVGSFGKVVATSQSIQGVLNTGADGAEKFGGALKSDAEGFVRSLRLGEPRFNQIDDWLGRLADYVEWAELARSFDASQAPQESLSSWLSEIIQAREQCDTVRLADVLEFEVMPRLPKADS